MNIGMNSDGYHAFVACGLIEASHKNLDILHFELIKNTKSQQQDKYDSHGRIALRGAHTYFLHVIKKSTRYFTARAEISANGTPVLALYCSMA